MYNIRGADISTQLTRQFHFFVSAVRVDFGKFLVYMHGFPILIQLTRNQLLPGIDSVLNP